MKEWRNGSPSQISTFTRCQRRWFFGSRMGIEQPQGAAAAIGEEGHNRTQSYLVAGTDPGKDELGDVVRAGLLFLPPPRSVSSAQVEKWIRVNAADHELPVDVVGQLDFEEPEIDRITDFKFRGRKASCTKPAHLYDDPQAVVYSFEYLVRKSPLGPIRFRHLNFIREGGPALPVEIAYEYPSDLKERFDRVIREPMWEMRKAADAEKVSDLPPNREACNDYGGCPYAGVCLASEVQLQVQSTPQGVPMASLADLFKTPAPAAPQPAAPSAPAAFVQPQPFVVPGAVVAAQPGNPNPPDAPPPAPVAFVEPVVEAAPAKKSRKEKAVTLADGREISGKVNLVAERAKLHGSVKTNEGKWRRYEAQSQHTQAQGTSLSVEELLAEVALLDHLWNQVEVVSSPQPQLSACVPTVKSEIVSGLGRVLSIGGSPYARSSVHFDEFIDQYAKTVCSSKSVSHIVEIEYNKGPGLVAAALTGDMTLRGPEVVLPEVLVVDRRHPCADAVIPILRVAYQGLGAQIFEAWGRG